MDLQRAINDLQILGREKKRLRECLYTALEVEDIISARMMYELLGDIEEREIPLVENVEEFISMN